MHFKYLGLLVVVLAACGRASPGPTGQPAQFPPRDEVSVDMDDLMDGLSTRDKIAQLVMPWIAGTYAAFDDDAFRRMQHWVDSLHVGGLLISVGSPLDVAAKLNRLQERSPLPLLVTSDLGSGHRYPIEWRHSVSSQYGHRSHRQRYECLRVGPHHGVGGACRRHSPRVRPGRRRQ